MRMIFLPLLLFLQQTNIANAFQVALPYLVMDSGANAIGNALQVALPSLVMDSGDHNCTVEATRRCILAVEDATDTCYNWIGQDDWEAGWNCLRAQARAALSCVDCYVVDASKFMWSCDEAHFRHWLDTVIWGWDSLQDCESFGCLIDIIIVVVSSYDCTCESIPFLVNLGVCPWPVLPVPWPPALN